MIDDDDNDDDNDDDDDDDDDNIDDDDDDDDDGARGRRGAACGGPASQTEGYGGGSTGEPLLECQRTWARTILGIPLPREGSRHRGRCPN